jgi:hypothetical protein
VGSGSTDDHNNFRCKVRRSDPLVETVDVDNIERSNPVTTLGDEDDHHHHHGHGHHDRWAKN